MTMLSSYLNIGLYIESLSIGTLEIKSYRGTTYLEFNGREMFESQN